MVARQNNPQTIMCKISYKSPELTLLDIEVEQICGASQGSPGFDIGIGGWEVDNEDYGNNAY